jgi:signal transduction histidine kinase
MTAAPDPTARLDEAFQDLRRANEELVRERRIAEQATRLKSDFLASMSHELRTPLNAILGFGELLETGAAGELQPLQREYIGHMLTSGRQLLRLVTDLLELSKLEGGKLELAPSRFRLGEAIDQVLALVRGAAVKKRQRLEVAISPELGEVIMDPGRFKQILFSYVTSARERTPEGGRVLVRAFPEARGGQRSEPMVGGVEGGAPDVEAPSRFTLEVEDGGPSVEHAELSRLFADLLANEEPATVGESTGVALALTRRLVEALGGTVDVRSQPGAGTTFVAVLPRL